MEHLTTNCSTSMLGRQWIMHPGAMVPLVCAYTALALASLAGNSAVLLIVAFKREMRSVTNMFIGSLAASDLMVTAVSLWTTPYYHYKRTWDLGAFMCKLSYMLSGASMLWSPFTLGAMAVERYMLVLKPFRVRMSRNAGAVVIGAIWLLVLLMLAPAFLHLEYVPVDPCHIYCLETWVSQTEIRFVYGMSVLLVRTVIPFGLIAFCHYKIAARLSYQSVRLQQCRSNRQQLQDVERKQRLQRLLISMIAIFGVCSFPLDIYNVLQDVYLVWNIHVLEQGARAMVFLLCHLVAMTGTLWNPLVYAWWNENFKREITLMVQCRSTLLARSQPFFSRVAHGSKSSARAHKKSSKSSSKLKAAQSQHLAVDENESMDESENDRLLELQGISRRLTLSTNIEPSRLQSITPSHEDLPEEAELEEIE